MNKQETAKLLAVIKTAFPNFEITELVARLWVEFMEDVPFERAQMNLKYHIKSNKFPPTISDIVQLELGSTTHGEALLLEAAERLDQFEQWKRDAVDPPESLLRRKRVTPIE
jgi:hypothetical protein